MCDLLCFILFFWQSSVYVRAYDMHLSSQKKKKKAASLAGVIAARGLSVGQDAMSAPC